MGELTVDWPVATAFAFALGACIGSFLNVVIWRLPRGESLVRPGSHCPGCGAPIPFWANVPLVSYALLRGRCRSCRVPISLRYPAVEALTGAVFAALLWAHGPGVRLLVDWALASALIAVTFIDIDFHMIPDSITLPGVVLGLGLSLAAPQLSVGWRDALLGVVVLGGLLWALSAGYEYFAGKIGFGMGDVKLVAMLASFLGLEAALGVLVVGSLVGIVYGVAVIVRVRGGRGTHVPFGPALALAGLVFLFEPNLLQRFLERS
ncbi:MAG TPA: prepilin peptidase [Myxococcota bacterium]|nr:prepilin peptidase [Myxococcota bacterium]